MEGRTGYRAMLRQSSLYSSPTARYVVGLLFAIGLMLPYFGRLFHIGGLHVRIVSYLLMMAVCLWCLPAFSFKKADNRTGLLWLAFVILAAAYSEPVQVRNILTMQFGQDFYEGKLALILQISTPYVLTAYLVSVWRGDAGLNRGLKMGFIGLGVLALAVLLGLWITMSAAPVDPTQYVIRNPRYSIISMSWILSFAFFSLVDGGFRSRVGWVASVLCCMALMAVIIIMRQRFPIVLLVGLLALRLVKSIDFRKWAGRLAVGTGLVLAAGYFVYIRLPDNIIPYWKAILPHAYLRYRILADAFLAGAKQPLGRGLGSYALDTVNGDFVNTVSGATGPLLYPHNTVVEAFYELGLFGAAVTGAFILLGLYHGLWLAGGRRVVKLVDQKAWFLFAIVFYAALHDLKAGTIAYMYMLPCFLLISPLGRLRDAQRP